MHALGFFVRKERHKWCENEGCGHTGGAKCFSLRAEGLSVEQRGQPQGILEYIPWSTWQWGHANQTACGYR